MTELHSRQFRGAMDAINALDRAASIDEVAAIIADRVAVFGLEHFCCLMPRAIDRPSFDACLMMTRWPAAWQEQYRRADFQLHDPIVRYTRTQLRCTSWHEAPIGDDTIARSIMTIAANDHGLRAGLCVPIHGIDAYQAGMSFAGQKIDDSPDARSIVELIAIYAFNRANTFRVAAAPAPIRVLTERQREVLTWTARGKSSWDTSRILNVSEDNVQKIVACATARLGATNRTHAVAKAILRKEIDL